MASFARLTDAFNFSNDITVSVPWGSWLRMSAGSLLMFPGNTSSESISIVRNGKLSHKDSSVRDIFMSASSTLDATCSTIGVSRCGLRTFVIITIVANNASSIAITVQAAYFIVFAKICMMRLPGFLFSVVLLLLSMSYRLII